MTRGKRVGGVLAAIAAATIASSASAAPTVQQCLDASERGQALRDEGKLSHARELFGLCSASACPAPVRSSCSHWLEDVLAKTPSIVVAVRDDDEHDVPSASMMIDGAASTKLTGQPIELDPGKHTLTVEAPGFDRATQTLVANVGEKNRLLRIRLPRASVRPPPPPETETTRRAEPAPSPPGSFLRPLAIGLGVGALATLGTSLVVGLGARSDASDLRDSPCGTTRTCEEGAADGIERRLLVADILLGATVVLAAGAILSWIAAPSSTPARQSLGTPLRFTF